MRTTGKFQMHHVVAFLLLMAPGVLVEACADPSCDPGQELVANECVPMPEDGGGGGELSGDGDGDAGPGGQAPGGATSGDGDGDAPGGMSAGDGDGSTGDGDGDTGDGDSGISEPFGQACTAATETAVCFEPAPTCALAPGQTEGYCSVRGCSSGEVKCPPGWSCFSLADACLAP